MNGPAGKGAGAVNGEAGEGAALGAGARLSARDKVSGMSGTTAEGGVMTSGLDTETGGVRAAGMPEVRG